MVSARLIKRVGSTRLVKLNEPSSGRGLGSIKCKIIRAGSLDSLKPARLAKRAGSARLVKLTESSSGKDLGSIS